MAQYPSQAATFSTKVTNQVIAASHVNDLQDEVAAVTDGLVNGLAHHLRGDVTATRDVGTSTRKFRDLYLSRNASVGGDLAVAGTLTGDGSGLTGVPIAGVLDDLSDVDAAAPTNGQLLTFNTSSGKWEAQTLSIGGGGVVNLDDLLDVVLTSPTEGDHLVYVSGQWINQQPSAVPRGTIVDTLKSSAPTGWLMMNGSTYLRADYPDFYTEFSALMGAGNGTTTFTTPDLSRRFTIGKAASGSASTIGETGGAFDHAHTSAAHSHAVGTLAVASHNHSAGTLAVDSHTHGAGTYAVGAHTHGAGSYVAASHTHTTTGLSTNSTGAHTHTGPSHTHAFSGTTGTNSGTQDASGSGTVVADGSHTHDFSGTTDAGGTGNTSSDGDHSHSISGSVDASGTLAVTGTGGSTTPSFSGASGAAAPALSGNTGSTAPSVSGSTASTTPSDTGTANPPYYTVNKMIRAL